ncbi:MAG TPA: hypothetical protein VN599_02665 [Rudaea sp.]|nr:hypothetical protein [Rudaea sp.]
MVDPFGRPLRGSPQLAIPQFDPSRESVFFDDFRGTVPTASPSQGNWSKTLNQAGSFSTAPASDHGSQGVWQIAANTTIGNNFFALNNGIASFTLAGAVHEWRIKTPVSLSNATNQYYIIAGVSDQRWVNGSATYDLTAQYTHTNANGAWRLVVKNNAPIVGFEGITPVQPSTWYRVRIVCDMFGTTAALYVNDIYQCTATGIPLTWFGIGSGHSAVTTGNNEVPQWDYFYLRQRVDRR